MAKKAPAPKKQESDSGKQLVDAIVTVKRLQDFIRAHGGLQRALDEVLQVHELIKLTGGVEQLRQALEIVGKEDAPQS